MELIFLGTGSAYPSPHRAASGAVLRNLLTGSQWLFDCGEGTQIQAQKSSSVKLGRISQIFISHLHGDHIYGLPGLLSTIGQRTQSVERNTDRVDLEIYGPQGLRRYLRLCLAISRSLLNFTYAVHELIFNPDQKPEGLGGQDWVSMEAHSTYDPMLPFERPGRDIHPDNDGFWRFVFDSTLPNCPPRDSLSNLRVHAVALKHTVASLGWFIFEPSGARRLSVEKACALGVPKGPLLGSLKKGNSVTFMNDDHQEITVSPEQVLLAPNKGRRFAILGDSCDSSELIRMLKCDFLEPISLDLLVHEATMHSSYGSDVFKKGHSTPASATQFAAAVGARHLVLTHFSQRYNTSAPKCEDVSGDSNNDNVSEDISLLLEEALSCKEFSGTIELAEDMKLIKIDS